MIKKISKKKISSTSNRLVPKYTRGASWLTLQVSFILALSVIVKDVEAQEEVYVTPDVNIFEYQEQVFELPGSGDYISREQVSKYNFKNINDILRNTPGVYSREENGFGIFPNISLRGVNTLRSAAIDLLEDGINIAPAPYSAPDAYYSPLAGKMHAIEVLKGSSQFRYGPHNTGGVINYVTTPIQLMPMETMASLVPTVQLLFLVKCIFEKTTVFTILMDQLILVASTSKNITEVTMRADC